MERLLDLGTISSFVKAIPEVRQKLSKTGTNDDANKLLFAALPELLLDNTLPTLHEPLTYF